MLVGRMPTTFEKATPVPKENAPEKSWANRQLNYRRSILAQRTLR